MWDSSGNYAATILSKPGTQLGARNAQKHL